MTMPRPSGKALEIATKTIPGLSQNLKDEHFEKKKDVPNDEVELKIVNINEHKGRLKHGKKAR